jgi:F-type H+-transporting ATPase subunit b
VSFDWTTFAIEIVNFLILVWLLQRFLYRPVLTVIEQRKAKIEQTLQAAALSEQNGLALKRQYEQQLTDWERDKEQARARLVQELNAERQRLIEENRVVMERERDKARALEQQRQQEVMNRLEQEALARGGEFVARLLTRLVSPALQAQLLELLLEDLAGLPAARREALHRALAGTSAAIEVVSALPLNEPERTALGGALQALAGHAVNIHFTEDPGLLAGLRVNARPWVLRANLQDELAFFLEALPHDGD